MKLVAYISARRETETPVLRAVKDAAASCGGRLVRFEESMGLTGVGNDLADFLRTADVVVAHVRQLNPNLLFEVGMAHGLGKSVVLIIPASLNLPIDLRGQRIISYQSKPEVAKLTFALKEWFQELERANETNKKIKVPNSTSSDLPVSLGRSGEEFVQKVAKALSMVPGWEIQASRVEERDGAFDFIVWNQESDSSLAALGNPIAIDVKSRSPSSDVVRRLAGITKTQGLRALLLIVGNSLPQKLRRSFWSIGNRSGIIVLALDRRDIESIASPNDFTRLLRRGLRDVRLA